MILTAQPFFNEMDLLEIKFRELSDVVDLHVIVEATTTFTGLPKPLYFKENAARFKRWPVIHRVIELPQSVPSPWDREAVQYQAVRQVVAALNPEIALWVDADECPRRNVVERFRGMNCACATLEMDHLLYYFDRMDRTQKWRNGKIGFYNRNAASQPWRGETHWPIMQDAGWHFEYCGGRGKLVEKLDGVSHAPEPACREHRNRVADGEMPASERTDFYPADRLPPCAQYWQKHDRVMRERYFSP